MMMERCSALFLLMQLFLSTAFGQTPIVNMKVTFKNTVNKVPVVLDSVSYTNCWNETYTINKLKYYISNVQLQLTDKRVNRETESYHLINEEDTATKSFSLSMPAGHYSSLSFLVGVDSLKNVSGAQTNALDPLNGMFWTWNNGYIMFKLEGNSPQSTVVNNKIEYHIGGFAGPNNSLRKVTINFAAPLILLQKENNAEIFIQSAIDKLWNAKHNLKIIETPVLITPGQLSSAIADNYADGFELIKIMQL
ncbi:MAG: hypothetical protein H7334_08550 [Ferruginibacter sp.]|nr:hypothetical protein [Ferruginibacter sp.]